MKAAVIGSVNIDYVYQMEHFIRPGETAPCRKLTIGCGGKGLNQSVALARAGMAWRTERSLRADTERVAREHAIDVAGYYEMEL